jgi:hypothetical protein
MYSVWIQCLKNTKKSIQSHAEKLGLESKLGLGARIYGSHSLRVENTATASATASATIDAVVTSSVTLLRS